MTTTTLWDRNGIQCYVEESEVEAFCERFEHREFSREPKPINLGISKVKALARFVGNRVASIRRRWKHKHERAVSDAMEAGEAQADAVAIADEKWGADPPTAKAVYEELVERDLIPATMREED